MKADRIGQDEKVYHALDDLGISYELHSHPPVYTVAEAQEQWDGIPGAHVKNLFLRNKKGNHHYLVIMAYDKPLDLKTLEGRLPASRLSFASERRLAEHLGVEPGSVSVFGILNDANAAVEVILDEELLEAGNINFHPNLNTATVTISTDDLRRFLESQPNPWRTVAI